MRGLLLLLLIYVVIAAYAHAQDPDSLLHERVWNSDWSKPADPKLLSEIEARLRTVTTPINSPYLPRIVYYFAGVNPHRSNWSTQDRVDILRNSIRKFEGPVFNANPNPYRSKRYLINLCDLLAVNYNRLGQYDSGLQSTIKALAIYNSIKPHLNTQHEQWESTGLESVLASTFTNGHIPLLAMVNSNPGQTNSNLRKRYLTQILTYLLNADSLESRVARERGPCRGEFQLNAKLNLALFYQIYLRDTLNARPYWREAADIVMLCPTATNRFLLANAMSTSYYTESRIDEAIRFAHLSLSMAFDTTALLGSVGKLNYTLAVLHARKGNYDSLRFYYNKVLADSINSYNPFDMQHLYSVLATEALARGQSRDAQEYFKRLQYYINSNVALEYNYALNNQFFDINKQTILQQYQLLSNQLDKSQPHNDWVYPLLTFFASIVFFSLPFPRFRRGYRPFGYPQRSPTTKSGEEKSPQS